MISRYFMIGVIPHQKQGDIQKGKYEMFKKGERLYDCQDRNYF